MNEKLKLISSRDITRFSEKEEYFGSATLKYAWALLRIDLILIFMEVKLR